MEKVGGRRKRGARNARNGACTSVAGQVTVTVSASAPQNGAARYKPPPPRRVAPLLVGGTVCLAYARHACLAAG